MALVLGIDEEIGEAGDARAFDDAAEADGAGRRRSWPSPCRPLSRKWRTWSHAKGSSGNGEALSARLGRDHSATRCGRRLVVDRRHGVVKLHRTHSATVNPPRPPISVSASASRTRLRPRIASRPPWAAPRSHAARPVLDELVDAVRGRNVLLVTHRHGWTHRGELIDRDLAGDVLRAEVDERVATAVVPAVGAQPIGPRAPGHVRRRRHVVEHDHPWGDVERVAKPARGGLLPGDARSRHDVDRRAPAARSWARAPQSGLIDADLLPSSRGSVRAGAPEGCRAARWRARRPRSPGGGSDSRLTASGPSGTGRAGCPVFVVGIVAGRERVHGQHEREPTLVLGAQRGDRSTRT